MAVVEQYEPQELPLRERAIAAYEAQQRIAKENYRHELVGQLNRWLERNGFGYLGEIDAVEAEIDGLRFRATGFDSVAVVLPCPKCGEEVEVFGINDSLEKLGRILCDHEEGKTVNSCPKCLDNRTKGKSTRDRLCDALTALIEDVLNDQ